MIDRMKNKIKNFSNEPIDFILLVIVFIMLALGLIMVMSASAPAAISKGNSAYSFVKTQAFSAGLGLVAMFIISKIDYRIYKKFYKIIYIGVLILLLAVLPFGRDAKRCYALGRTRPIKLSTI